MKKFPKVLLSLYLSVLCAQSSSIEIEEPYDLYLNLSPMTDTSILRKHPDITSLNLFGSAITSLDEVICLTNLKRLNLEGCSRILYGIPKLEALVNLEELNLSFIINGNTYPLAEEGDVPSLEFLTRLPKLKKLIMHTNDSLRMHQLEPTSLIPSLRYLDVTSNEALTFDPTIYSSQVRIKAHEFVGFIPGHLLPASRVIFYN